MDFKPYSLIYLFVTSTILISFIWFWPDKQVHLVSCDIGQGDAYLVSKGFTQILVDGGKNEQILNCLDQFIPYWDRQIEIVIASHDDHDHVGGLTEVMKHYKVNNLIWNGKDSNSQDWKIIQLEADQQGTKVRKAYEGNLLINKLKLDFIWPQKQPSSNVEDNQASIVTRFSYEDFSVMFTGDIDTLTEEKLVSGSVGLDSTVLKVSHHGSRYATSDKWLELVNPKIALIGVGKNSYGHPSEDVLSKLNSAGVTIYRTDKDGSVEISSDGVDWKLEQDGLCTSNTLSNLIYDFSNKFDIKNIMHLLSTI